MPVPLIAGSALLGAASSATGWCPTLAVGVTQIVLPWTTAASGIAALSMVHRRSAPRALAAVSATIGAAVLAPKLVQRRPVLTSEKPGPTVDLVLANLYIDNEEAIDAFDQLVSTGPEILVMTELTDELLGEFDERYGDTFPHRVLPERLETEYDPGIFTTLPVRTSRVFEHGTVRLLELVVEPEPGTTLRVLTAHPVAPENRRAFRTWRRQLDDLSAALESTDGPTLLVGDLNAGTLQSPYERLVTRTRFRDAHDELGVALKPSWGIAPSLPRWVPSLVARLDHLLISPELTVVQLDDLDPVGSDHRPFVARIKLTQLAR